MLLIEAIALPIVVAIIALVIGYFTNQLPEMRDLSSRPWLVGRLMLWFASLIVALERMLPTSGLSDSERQVCHHIVVAMIVALMFDGCALVRLLRTRREDSENLPPDLDIRSRLVAEHHRMIKQRLDWTVGEYEPINLIMQSKPEAVAKRGDSTEKILVNSVKKLKKRWQLFHFLKGDRRNKPESKSTLLSTFEDEDIGGRLLILGNPGSGKTTILLKLADALLERAKGTNQIPYLFELSNWQNNQQSLADWMTAQLELDYKIDPSVSKKWIVSGQLIPLLDGLDEVKSSHMTSCIEKINDFVRCMCMPQVVVCCRIRQYEESRLLLDSLNGALRLKPLKNDQIQKYFEDSGQVDIWYAIQDEPGLHSLLKPIKAEQSTDTGADSLPILRVPLFLQILTVAYQSGERLSSKEDLFDAYIDKSLSSDRRTWDRRQGTLAKKAAKQIYEKIEDEPSTDKTKKYLGWLGKQLLETERRNDFLIEQMQPTWLSSSRTRWLYRLMFGLAIGLISGVILIRLVGFSGGMLSGLVFGLFFGVAGEPLGGLVFGIEDINPVERITFSFSNFEKEKFINNLAFGIIIGLIGGLIAGLLGGLAENLVGGLLFSLVFGLLGGLRSGLQEKLVVRRIPNQGIFRSAMNLIPITLCLYPAGLAIPAIQKVLLNSDMSFLQILSYGYSYTLLMGFALCGGLAVVQHTVLRFLLWREGAIPWNYAKFLRYTTERRLTQQVGGHFRFVHRELLEHFASKYG